MNENERCAANGCPLFGTRKTATNGEGAWFCSCHFNREPAQNDAITAKLRLHMHIVNATIDIRRFYGTEDWADAYRGVKKLLREAERLDLMIADDEPVRTWLARLEGTLIELTVGIGKKQRLSTTVPTAPVIGPTHASAYFWGGGRVNRATTQGIITFAAAIATGSAVYAVKTEPFATAPVVFILATLFGMLAGFAQIKEAI